MRYLLILAMCLSACGRSPAGSESEVASPDGSDTAATVKPSEATHPLVDVEGWTGPAAVLSDGTERGPSRCTRIQMMIPSTEEAPASEEELKHLRSFFAQVLSRWDDKMTLLEQGCDEAFADRSALSQCEVETALGAAPLKSMNDEERGFLETYTSTGKLLLTYKYYDPRTAIDDPRFERQCEQLKGDWRAVSVDSPEYKDSLKLYPAGAGSTAAVEPDGH